MRATEPQEGLQYKKPTLFVGGGKSQFIKPEYHEKIHAFFPNAKIEMIPVPTAPHHLLFSSLAFLIVSRTHTHTHTPTQDADHWVHFEKPNEFCHAVESFLHRTQQ